MISPMFLQFLSANILSPEIVAFFMGIFMIFLFFLFVMYIFMSFAFVSIARRVHYSSPSIAWIPSVGPAIIANKISKMPSWPLFLLIGSLFPLIGIFFSIAFTIFFTIWMWKTYEAINRPGWWSILLFIPILGLIFLGIAAWSKSERTT